ncbi:neural cell adhesion molecule 1-like isoform X2 [Oculina patagonica]
MVFLLTVVLLVLAGGIHSSPVPANFSFEVSSKFEVISVYFGDDADFNCKTNDPSASVTFKKSVPPKDPIKITNSDSTFTVHNVTIHDAGHYQCTAKRMDGQVITRDIFLAIFDIVHPEVAIIPFKSKRILTGSDLTYTCEGTMGTVTWYKVVRGSPVQLPMPSLPGVSVKSSFGANKIARKDLMFSNAGSSHSGVYECALLTKKGFTLERSIQVDVRGPDPAKIIASSNHDILVDSDSDLELVCQTIGFPPPVVTWKKDNQLIPECREDEPCAATERYLVTHKGLKIKTPRYPDDDAEFSCKAKNDFGEDQRSFIVVVPSAPVLDKSYAKTYYWTGHLIKPKDIPCVLAEGSPTPSFSWSYKFCWSLNACMSWAPVTQKPNIFQVKNGISRSTLVVTSQYLPQYLYFKCTAKNMKGKDEITAGLFERSNGRRY